MKIRTGFVLGLLAIAAASGLFLYSASAQIATPTVIAVADRSATVPFDLYRGNRIVLPGRINGIATPMVLDSGAGVTTLDRAFAKKIGLAGGQEVTAHGVSGQQQAELFQDVTIEVGNLKFSGVTVVAIDLSQVAKANGRPMPVVLGHEVFANSVIGIDFGRSQLTMSSSANFAAPVGATEVRLKRDGTMHFLPVSIGGLPAVDASLDLGNAGAISVSQEYQVQHPLFGSLPSAIGMGGGVGGLHEIKRVSLPTVEFGGFVFNAVPADLGSVPGGPFKGRANAGIQMFRPFDLTMDLGHDRMWLKRNAKAVDFPKDRSGLFTLLDGDHFNVLHVSPGSPADRAGLKKGDALAAIDGTAVGPAFFKSRMASWASGVAGRKIELTKAGGTKVTLTLADYF